MTKHSLSFLTLLVVVLSPTYTFSCCPCFWKKKKKMMSASIQNNSSNHHLASSPSSHSQGSPTFGDNNEVSRDATTNLSTSEMRKPTLEDYKNTVSNSKSKSFFSIDGMNKNTISFGDEELGSLITTLHEINNTDPSITLELYRKIRNPDITFTENTQKILYQHLFIDENSKINETYRFMLTLCLKPTIETTYSTITTNDGQKKKITKTIIQAIEIRSKKQVMTLCKKAKTGIFIEENEDYQEKTPDIEEQIERLGDEAMIIDPDDENEEDSYFDNSL